MEAKSIMNCLAQLPSKGMTKKDKDFLPLSLLGDVASLDKESWVLFICIYVAQSPNKARI